jgi:hypothetical protein
MPESRKRPAPLSEDFSKVFGSTKTSQSAPETAPARAVLAGPLCPYCKNSLGEAHTVSSKANRTDAAEFLLIFCTRCGMTLGVLPGGDDY